MNVNRMTLLASAVAAALSLGMSSVQAVQRVPVSAAESTNLWFVEFNGAPTSEGARLSTVQSEKASFRKAAVAAGVKYKLRRSFDSLFNGISIEITPSERARLARLPGIKAMYPVMVVKAPEVQKGSGATTPEMITALAMTGADLAQNKLGLTGQGIKVGIIDSGIDIDHPDLGGGGTPGGTAFPTTRVAYGYDFVGDAFNADPASAAYNPVPMPDANPDDCGGHGSHVAGIVGANGALKGVAPDVTFGAYRVFGCAGSTTSDIIIEAMERALADGMQVVNQSLGASFQWPEYPTAKAANRLVNKGVVMVASIGNSGTSGLYAAGAPGVGAKVIGVASYDNSHYLLREAKIAGDAQPFGFADATGAPAAPISGTTPLARTGTVASTADACAALPADSLTGKIALIRRGTCSFYTKASFAAAAGASGVILYNNVPGLQFVTVAGTPAITIPVVTVSDTTGAMLDSRIAAGDVSLSWTDGQGSYPNTVSGGLISSFSSYGLAADLSLKPNIGAPGGNIISTYPLEAGAYATLSGTSMSSPNVAGSVALLLQAKPGLSAENVKVRLQNWADPKNWSGNAGLGYLDFVHRQGAGMVDVVQSVKEQTSVTPSELSLGESQVGPVTRTLTLSNQRNVEVTFALGHVAALATGPSTYTPAATADAATVAFSSNSVTVPAKGKATVDVTITAPAAQVDRGIYGGYLTATSSVDGKAMRVPYAGYKGDYQAIPVLTSGGYGFPWLTQLVGGFYENRPSGAAYTLVGDDYPIMLMHLDHHSAKIKIKAINATTGKVKGLVSVDQLLPRNSTSTGFFTFSWDGSTLAKEDGGAPVVQPNGDYVLEVSVLKALGDPANAAHWEVWTSPMVTLARP
ncbi:S8 family serine peptidase [Ideonella sp.]|uniref:S8 family serine peptidase n=1 Tax=Ideonella sp. TaxID=1929293 RepID=UPI003BB544A3